MIIRELITEDFNQLLQFMHDVPPVWGVNDSKIQFRNAVLAAFLNSERFYFYGGFENNNLIGLGSIYYWRDLTSFTLSSVTTNAKPSHSNWKNIISPITNYILQQGVKNNRTKYYRIYPLKYSDSWRRMSTKYSPEHRKFDHFIDQTIPANSWPKYSWQRSFLMDRTWPIDTVIEYGILKSEFNKII